MASHLYLFDGTNINHFTADTHKDIGFTANSHKFICWCGLNDCSHKDIGIPTTASTGGSVTFNIDSVSPSVLKMIYGDFDLPKTDEEKAIWEIED